MGRKAPEIFAERVHIRLDQLGWTQKTFAQKLGIKASGVSKVLSENRAPRSDTVIAWAHALAVTPNWILGFDEEETLDRLRTSCITAIVSATPAELTLFRDAFPKLFESASNQVKAVSAN